ncbi:MAG: PorT family protein [Bacteroidetes bacterium]|nr:MAG: PorT family protein [Bacteroidota bacterium]TAG89209.1 MAG: PorT family protein [Bacteroidota bacterium]
MKNNFFYFILVSIFFLNITKTNAQNIQFGLRVGMNASWIGQAPENGNTNGTNFGFTGGAWVRIAFRDPDESAFYVQPELLYSTFGSKYTTSVTTPFGTSEKKSVINFNNFELPILAGYKIMLGEESEIRLYAGPVFARVNSAKQIETTTIVTNAINANTPATKTTGETEIDITDKMKGVYTAGLVGVGFNIKKFTIDLRFQKVFTNMYQNSTGEENRPAMIQLGVGYRIF